jgi:hypothetical protein
LSTININIENIEYDFSFIIKFDIKNIFILDYFFTNKLNLIIELYSKNIIIHKIIINGKSSIFLSYDKFNAINFYKNLELNFLVKFFNFNFFFSKIFNFNDISNQHSIKNIFSKQFYSNDLLKVKMLDSHKNKNTFFSNSNKFFLVYKYLIDSIDDTGSKVSDDNYFKFYDMLSNRLLIQNIVRRQYKSFNSHVVDYFDSDIFDESLDYTSFDFPTTLNVIINQ